MQHNFMSRIIIILQDINLSGNGQENISENENYAVQKSFTCYLSQLLSATMNESYKQRPVSANMKWKLPLHDEQETLSRK